MADAPQSISLNIPGVGTVTFPGATFAPVVTPAPAPTPTPTPVPVTPKMAIGTNIAANDPYQTYAPWCDVTRQMGGWFAAVVTGAQITGWTPDSYPTGVSNGGVARANMYLYGYPTGVYKFTWTGTKDGLVLGRGGKVIGNITGDGTNWTGTCTFNTGDLIELQQTGGQTNIHIYAPDAVDGTTFRKQFTDALRPYKVLRLMPWARVNGEMRKDPATGNPSWPLQWSQRNLPTNWDQTSREVALEYQLQLAKESGCIPWINTYYGQSDDSLTQTAQLVKSYNFPLAVVESQNEYWNQGPGYQGNLIRNDGVKAELSADPNVAGAKLAAQIGANVGKIFRGVLGADKVKVVFGAQAVWGAWARDGLTSVPAGSFDALAIAPYFWNATALPATATPADWEASCLATINTTLDGGIADNAAVAKAAGVELWTYEGGQNLFPLMQNAPNMPLQDPNLAAFNADFITKFQTDPAMGRLYDQLFAVCLNRGVKLFTHFYLCGYWGKSGYWGAKQFLSDPDGPKSLSIQKAISAGNS